MQSQLSESIPEEDGSDNELTEDDDDLHTSNHTGNISPIPEILSEPLDSDTDSTPNMSTDKEQNIMDALPRRSTRHNIRILYPK